MPRRSVSWLTPPLRSAEITFGAPAIERAKVASSTTAIRFVEPAAATN